MGTRRTTLGTVLTLSAAVLALGISSGVTSVTANADDTTNALAADPVYNGGGYWDGYYGLPSQIALFPNDAATYQADYDRGATNSQIAPGKNSTLGRLYNVDASKVAGNAHFYFIGDDSGESGTPSGSNFNQDFAAVAGQPIFYRNWVESTGGAFSLDMSGTSTPDAQKAAPLLIDGGIIHIDSDGKVISVPTKVSPKAVLAFTHGWSDDAGYKARLESGATISSEAIGFQTDADGNLVLPNDAAQKWIGVSGTEHVLYAPADLFVETGGTNASGQPNQVKFSYVVLYSVNKDKTPTITTRNTTINLGTAWNNNDNIVSGTNEYGTALKNDDITTSGTVNTNAPGTYTVNYSYTTAAGQKVTEPATVTVVNPNTGGGNTGGGNTGTNPGGIVTPPAGGGTTTTTEPNTGTDGGTTTTTDGSEIVVPSGTAKKNQAIYAIKGLYMYSKPTFTKANRGHHYTNQKRVDRPMFVVTGYAKSTNGVLRYKVKDVNHNSKTAGKTGYITANSKFVQKVYYQTLPKAKTITVISKGGLNAYKKSNLTGKVQHYKKGTHLKVKKIVKHDLTTRYQLSNGNYVSTNKKLIIAGKY